MAILTPVRFPGTVCNLMVSVAVMGLMLVSYMAFSGQYGAHQDPDIENYNGRLLELHREGEEINQLIEKHRLALADLTMREDQISILLQKQKRALERSTALQDKLYLPMANSSNRNTQINEGASNVAGDVLHPDVNVSSVGVDVFEVRRKRVQAVCDKYSQIPHGGVAKVFAHASSGVLYCMVPKAGCTFWKKIFYNAKVNKNATATDILSISRFDIHNKLEHSIASGFNPSTHSPSNYPTRLIVTRDPYSRLLSSYLDKEYLPPFWFKESPMMMDKLKAARKKGQIQDDSHDFLRQHFNSMANVPEFHYENLEDKVKQSTQNDEKCFKFLTFAQFVRFGLDRKEPHWMPIHTLCDPCKFGATHISKMDSFSEDARGVLKKMGMETVLDDMDDKQVDMEMSMLIEFNFNLVHRDGQFSRYDKCLNNKELAYRLWQNFKWHGYIDPVVDYVIPNVEDEMSVRSDLMGQLKAARASGMKDEAKMKKAKKEFERRMYETLPQDLYEKLNEKYKIDFEFFGYENKREELRKMYESGQH